MTSFSSWSISSCNSNRCQHGINGFEIELQKNKSAALQASHSNQDKINVHTSSLSAEASRWLPLSFKSIGPASDVNLQYFHIQELSRELLTSKLKFFNDRPSKKSQHDYQFTVTKSSNLGPTLSIRNQVIDNIKGIDKCKQLTQHLTRPPKENIGPLTNSLL